MRLKVTDLAIQHLKFRHPQATYWDTMLPAFGVRVGTRSKTFIVMQGKARKRQTIGRYPAMKLQKALAQARLLLTSETSEIPAISLQHAVEEYLGSVSTRTRAATEYEWLLKRHSSQRWVTAASKYLTVSPIAGLKTPTKPNN